MIVLHAIAVIWLWRHWDLGAGLRNASGTEEYIRYIARVGFLVVFFPLFLAFEYLLVKSLVTKEGFLARLALQLYGKK